MSSLPASTPTPPPTRRRWPIPGRRLGLFLCLVFLGVGAAYGWFLLEWRWALEDLRAARPREARQKLLRCEWLWPRNAELHRMLARSAWLARDFSAAELHLQTSQKLMGGATDRLQLEYLLLRVMAGEADEAAVALGTYLTNGDAESPVILETLAGAYIRDLRYGPAYQVLDRWQELQPDNARPYHWRGWVLERMNQPKSAMEDYLRALELDPELSIPRLRVAEMLLEDKQPENSLRHLERLRSQKPDDPVVMARLGQCRYLEGKADEARELLEKARLSLPKDGPLLLHLAKLDVESGQADAAILLLTQLLDRDPNDTEARFQLVVAQRLAGQPQEAEKTLAEYERQNKLLRDSNQLLQEEAQHPSTDADSVARIGIMLLELNQQPQGLYWLEKALERDPRSQSAHRALMLHYDARGNTGLAAQHRARLNEK